MIEKGNQDFGHLNEQTSADPVVWFNYEHGITIKIKMALITDLCNQSLLLKANRC